MNLPIAMTFQRAPTPFPHFMPLDPVHAVQPWPKQPPRLAAPHRCAAHQGHVDNHHALRAQLQERGYPFETNNDCELIAHLIDAIHPGNPLHAVQRAMALLQGQSTFAVQFHDHPYRLITAKSGSAQTPSQLIDMRG